jgi:integrase
MGLGGYPLVPLAAARRARDRAEQLLRQGINPAEAGKPHGATFGEATEALLAAKAPEWRNAKHRAQWAMTLRTYAAPLWPVPVAEVDTAAVLTALQPVWQAKPETASRLRGRIEAVLDFAKAHGRRDGENPARWRGHLDKLLPKRQKLTRGHFAAMAYREVPAFMATLRGREGIAAMALEFCILTAARSGEVLGARWAEIDLEAKVWTILAKRTKAGREHRVPLSGRALAILGRLAEAKTGDFIFAGQRLDRPLSPMALTMVLRRMNIEGVTVHGFRSAVRDWCGEETSFPREICEAALAHVTGDKTEAAYRRGDALEKRRALMEAWASYCEASSNVLPLRAIG